MTRIQLRWGTFLAVALVLGLAAPRAYAATTTVKYDLRCSSAVITPNVGAQITIPSGAMSGMMSVVYSGTTGSGIVTGPTTLKTFTLVAPFSNATVTGTATFSLLSSITGGSLTAMGYLTPGSPGSGVFGVNSRIHCKAGFFLCFLAGLPFSTPVVSSTTSTIPLPSLAYGTFPWHTANSSTTTYTGVSSGSVTVPITSPVSGTFMAHIVGKEIMRTHP